MGRVSIVRTSQRRTLGVVLVYHKVMYTKASHVPNNRFFSCRIEDVVSLKSLHLKIGPVSDLVWPTSNLLTNIMIESSWMGAIWRPCSIQAGRTKLLYTRVCACRLFWYPALTHWGRDKMAAIFQATFSNAFSWMKIYENTEVCS